MSFKQDTEYGKICSDFSSSLLSELCERKKGIQTGPFGSQLHKKDYVEKGTPIITVEHLNDNRITMQNMPFVSDDDKERLSKYSMKKGDIIFSRVGSVDRRSLVRNREDGWLFSGRCLRIRPLQEKIDSTYLSYFFGLEIFKEHVRRIAVGATMPSINTKILSNLKVYYPELAEQKAIANMLSSLDEKIEVNNQINETLENMAQALFKEWFVDFEFPNEEGEPFKSSGGEMVESELKLIPKNWQVKQLKEVSESVSGYSYKGKELMESSNAMITIKNFHRNGGFKLDGFKEILLSERVKDKHFAKPLDIIVAHTDLTQNADIIGNPVLIVSKDKYDKIIFSMDTVKIVPNTERFRYFIYSLLKDSNFKGYALGFTTGTTVLHLSKKSLPMYKFACPPEYYIHKYNTIVKSFFNRIVKNNIENGNLNKTRNILLPKLMSGEIRIPIDETEESLVI